MRIRTAFCSLVLVIGLSGGVLTATGASAAKKLDPCPGAGVPTATSVEPAVYPAYDDPINGGNGDGYVCVGGHKITDDHCTYDGTVCII